MEKAITGIIRILKNIKSYINTKSSNLLMFSFDTSKEVINLIDDHIKRLSRRDISKINDLIVLFLPTSDFQEIAISNGWSEEYLEMAKEFDNLINSLKKEL
ncbi:MAG: hypothetical protein ACFE96_18070 [Candidatus Hermodarchaeota archaeon]